MRRKDKEIKEPNTVSEILTRAMICRVAFFDEEYPYVIPMNYGFKNNVLYFHCAKEGKKLDLIRRNNKVSFVIEEAHEILRNEDSCKWTTRYRSVMGFGKMNIVTDFKEKTEGLDIIMSHHGKTDNQYSEKAVDSVVILKLEIEKLSAKQSGKW